MKFDAKSAAVGGVLGALVGGGVVYLALRRRYEQKLESEVTLLDKFHAKRIAALKAGRDPHLWPATPVGNEPAGTEESEDLEAARPAIADDDLDELEPEEDTRGYGEPILTELDEPWPPHDRDNSKPYVISVAELGDQGPAWELIELRWYHSSGPGGVLVDDKDEIIDDRSKTTGPLSALMFGGPSGDPRTCYIRNPYLDCDFEVILDDRDYGTHGAGLDPVEEEDNGDGTDRGDDSEDAD